MREDEYREGSPLAYRAMPVHLVSGAMPLKYVASFG